MLSDQALYTILGIVMLLLPVIFYKKDLNVVASGIVYSLLFVMGAIFMIYGMHYSGICFMLAGLLSLLLLFGSRLV
jgi:hypothetical protein